MRVVVAYCSLHPETKAAVEAALREGDEVVWADTSASDIAYYELLADQWREGKTFVLLEQDKLPKPGALRELYDCPEPWCTYPVPMAHNGQPASFVTLSCTKFAAELMLDWPDTIERAGQRDYGYGAKHWNRLDMAVAAVLNWRLGACHWHELGRVGHDHVQRLDVQANRS